MISCNNSCVQVELKETAEAVQAVWVGKDVSYNREQLN